MKKLMFFVTLALFSAQIVKADDIKNATLKAKGTQTDASTIAWLRSDPMDVSLINMSQAQFSKGLKSCLVEFNEKYKTFTEIAGDVIYDDIIPNLYTKALTPGRLYSFSYWNATTKTWGKWNRVPEPGEKGLFYPGWDDDPIMSQFCWNFGYPSKDKTVISPVNNQKTEIVVLPGVNTYTYKTDTVRERYDSYKEVENNFFVKNNVNRFTNTNNQSFDVETNNASYAVNKQSNCGCPNPNIQSNNEQSCGCTRTQLCQYHYNQLPQQEKKKFGQTTVGKVLKYFLAYAAGVGTGLIIANNSGHSSGVPNREIIQPPLELLPRVINYTQPPLQQIFQ